MIRARANSARLLAAAAFFLLLFPDNPGVLRGQEKGSSAGTSEKSDEGPSAADWEVFLPEGDGKSYVTSLCQSCHPLKNVVLQRKDEAGWRGTLGTMSANGASLFPDDTEILAKYLAGNFGPNQTEIAIPLHLNKASAEELLRFAVLTKDDVGKLVSARSKTPLKSLEDLKKILSADQAAKLKPFVTIP